MEFTDKNKWTNNFKKNGCRQFKVIHFIKMIPIFLNDKKSIFFGG